MKIIIIPLSVDGYLFNSGSERIRCRWLAPHLKADIYVGSGSLEEYDVIIYQKCYLSKQVKDLSIKYSHKLQIFDVCDPEWLFRPDDFHAMAKRCNFITCSSEDLRKELSEMGYKTYLIPDRLELKYFSGIKKYHQDRPISLTWFGYAGNFDPIVDMIKFIEHNDLPLWVISDKPTGYGKWIKWDEKDWLHDIMRGDIVLNPKVKYKSNNKTITSWALGMPVAHTIEDISRFLSLEERENESKIRIKEVQEKWNISQSSEELLSIINETIKNKS